MEELREKQLDLTIKTDTVFKEIFIQKYDTIYKTIIKEIPLYKEKQVPKKLKNKKQNNDLSFLTPSKTPELIHKNTEAISLYTKEIPVKKQKITHSQQLKPSIKFTIIKTLLKKS